MSGNSKGVLKDFFNEASDNDFQIPENELMEFVKDQKAIYEEEMNVTNQNMIKQEN